MNEQTIQVRSDEAQVEDASLIGDFRAGDRQAFNRLVLKYQDRMVNFCIRYVGSRQDGEDAAQETFVKAYRGLPSFKGDALFSTWLYQIAVNTCRNRHKSWWNRLRRRSTDLDAPVEMEEGSRARELSDNRFSPEKDLERKRINAAVQKGLQSLPAAQREIVVLRDIDEMSYEEIEKITGISLGTVKSRLARGREALQPALKEFAHGT